MTEVTQVLQQLLEGQKRLQEEVEQLKGKARAEATTGDMDEDTAEAERGEQGWEAWPEEPPSWDAVLKDSLTTPLTHDGMLLCALLEKPPKLDKLKSEEIKKFQGVPQTQHKDNTEQISNFTRHRKRWKMQCIVL